MKLTNNQLEVPVRLPGDRIDRWGDGGAAQQVTLVINQAAALSSLSVRSAVNFLGSERYRFRPARIYTVMMFDEQRHISCDYNRQMTIPPLVFAKNLLISRDSVTVANRTGDL